MAKITLEERRLRLVGLATRAQALAAHHRADALGWGSRKPDKAAKATAAAEGYDRLERGHRAEIERLDARIKANSYRLQDNAKAKAALQARAAAQSAERPTVDPLQAYMQAMQEVERWESEIVNLRARRSGLPRVGAETKAAALAHKIDKRLTWADDWRKEALALIASSGRDLVAERVQALEAERRRQGQDSKASGYRKDLKVETDLRTAAGQREYVGGGGKGARVASLADYAMLIPRPQDRTATRLEAMQVFDTICGWAEEGLFPAVDLEPKSRGAGGGGGFFEGLADAHQQIARLRTAIGSRNVDMLKARIFQRQTLTALSREGYGPEKAMGALTIAAIDAMAIHLAHGTNLNAIRAGQATAAASAAATP